MAIRHLYALRSSKASHDGGEAFWMSAASTGLPRHAPCWGTKFRRVCEKVAKKKQGVALLSWLRGRLSANRLYNEFTVGG